MSKEQQQQQQLRDFLTKMNACSDARDWSEDFDGQYRKAWDECKRGDWLLWIAAKTEVDRKLVVRAAVAVARTALKYVPKGENRPRICLDTVERWCDGDATIEEVRAARQGAWDAVYAAYAARYAAVYAVYAAYAVADAARYAAYAARYAAVYAADADAYAASASARKRALARHANIVRSVIPYTVILAAAKAKGLGEGEVQPS